MKAKRLQKMQLKKTTISRINRAAMIQLKGGTRQGDITHVPNTGLETHCANVVCY